MPKVSGTSCGLKLEQTEQKKPNFRPGDGIHKNYALIINDDTEPRHQKNVEQAIHALRKEGKFEISVASPSLPLEKSDHYQMSNSKGVERLIQGLQSKMDNDDRLILYVTGHGDKGDQAEGCVNLDSGCFSFRQLKQLLDKVAYGNRFVYLDTCQSGNALQLFQNNRTQVLTVGSSGEDVACHLFSPYFWSTQVTDSNQDGIVTITERHAFAMEQGSINTYPQLDNRGEQISLSGKKELKKPFSSKVITIHSKEEMDIQLNKLQVGQYALVTFSADWCGPCKQYAPVFDKLAKEYKGQFLMIRLEGKEGSENNWADVYGIEAFPTVAFIDHKGQITKVENRMDPVASFDQVSLHTDEDKAKYYLQQLRSPDTRTILRAASNLGKLGPAAKSILPQLEEMLTQKNQNTYNAAVIALVCMGEFPRLEAQDLFETSLAYPQIARILSEVYPKLEPKDSLDFLASQLESEDPIKKTFSLSALSYFDTLPDKISEQLYLMVEKNNISHAEAATIVLLSKTDIQKKLPRLLEAYMKRSSTDDPFNKLIIDNMRELKNIQGSIQQEKSIRSVLQPYLDSNQDPQKHLFALQILKLLPIQNEEVKKEEGAPHRWTLGASLSESLPRRKGGEDLGFSIYSRLWFSEYFTLNGKASILGNIQEKNNGQFKEKFVVPAANLSLSASLFLPIFDQGNIHLDFFETGLGFDSIEGTKITETPIGMGTQWKFDASKRLDFFLKLRADSEKPLQAQFGFGMEFDL